jgi:2-phospho-L-lactate guanylyltransferase
VAFDLCIVPMKPLARAKARLADVLDPEQRRALSLAMLADVVAAARVLGAVWVLNSDEDAVAVAKRAGGEPRPDPTPDAGLNASLIAATEDAVAAGARGVLVLSADCAAATPDDVRAVSGGPGVMIAPDRYGTGTNALWRNPPALIEPTFGPRSRRAHEAQARAHGFSFALVPRPGLAFDIDRAADLEHAREVHVGEATRAMLETLGYPSRRR